MVGLGIRFIMFLVAAGCPFFFVPVADCIFNAGRQFVFVPVAASLLNVGRPFFFVPVAASIFNGDRPFFFNGDRPFFVVRATASLFNGDRPFFFVPGAATIGDVDQDQVMNVFVCADCRPARGTPVTMQITYARPHARTHARTHTQAPCTHAHTRGSNINYNTVFASSTFGVTAAAAAGVGTITADAACGTRVLAVLHLRQVARESFFFRSASHAPPLLANPRPHWLAGHRIEPGGAGISGRFLGGAFPPFRRTMIHCDGLVRW
jgi:hypothetical protein